MKKVPIRLKLAAAFAFAMVVVLSGAGWFVYGRLRADLDESVNLSLQSRWEAADRWVGSDLGSFPLEEPDESFVQLLDEQRIVSSAGVVAAPVLVNGEFDSAAVSDVAGRTTGIRYRRCHPHPGRTDRPGSAGGRIDDGQS